MEAHICAMCPQCLGNTASIYLIYGDIKYHGKIWQLPLFAYTSLKASTELVI